MTCNVFPGMINCVIIFLCYVRPKFMFGDIVRTGKTSFIFTFKDTKIDCHLLQHMLGTDFLLSHVQLLRQYPVEIQQSSKGNLLHHLQGNPLGQVAAPF